MSGERERPRLIFCHPTSTSQTLRTGCANIIGRATPLFIPEVGLGPFNAVQALYAFGQHDAIGFSPFSIESAVEPTSSLLAASYDVLAQLTPLILEHQGKGTMAGMLPEGAEQRSPQRVRWAAISWT